MELLSRAFVREIILVFSRQLNPIFHFPFPSRETKMFTECSFPVEGFLRWELQYHQRDWRVVVTFRTGLSALFPAHEPTAPAGPGKQVDFTQNIKGMSMPCPDPRAGGGGSWNSGQNVVIHGVARGKVWSHVLNRLRSGSPKEGDE